MSVIDNPLYHRALALLARRDYSQKELSDRLSRYDSADPELIEQILQRLIELGYQNDARFAESYVRYRATRGFGPERLLQELRQRDVSSADTEQALAAYAEHNDWQAVAMSVWQKKFPHKYRDFPEKAKQHQFLRYRGFTDEQIQQVFSELE